jgi:hypothetical protein
MREGLEIAGGLFLADVKSWDVHVAPCGQVRLFIDAAASGVQVAEVLYRTLPATSITHGDEAHRIGAIYGRGIEYRFTRIPEPDTVP